MFLNRDSEGRGKENSLRECGVWRAAAVVVVGSDEQKRDKNDSSLSAHYTHAHTHTRSLSHMALPRCTLIYMSSPSGEI